MLYIIGQVLVCLMLTAALGALAGWLVRGYHARAELSSMQRRLHRQARDLRGRGATPGDNAHPRAQQQLRHQLVRLQAQVEQRDKEIAQLRRVLGEERPPESPKASAAPTAPVASPGQDASAPRAAPQRKPG
ncbi:MAG: hypothetical protein AAF184_08860 [Pseudomonadota bacterium]